MVFLPKGC